MRLLEHLLNEDMPNDASEQPGDLRDLAERWQCRPERCFCGAISTQGGREPSECRLRRLLSRSLRGRHVDCYCPPTDEGQSAVLRVWQSSQPTSGSQPDGILYGSGLPHKS